jgi:hypothetical protein
MKLLSLQRIEKQANLILAGVFTAGFVIYLGFRLGPWQAEVIGFFVGFTFGCISFFAGKLKRSHEYYFVIFRLLEISPIILVSVAAVFWRTAAVSLLLGAASSLCLLSWLVSTDR